MIKCGVLRLSGGIWAVSFKSVIHARDSRHKAQLAFCKPVLKIFNLVWLSFLVWSIVTKSPGYNLCWQLGPLGFKSLRTDIKRTRDFFRNRVKPKHYPTLFSPKDGRFAPLKGGKVRQHGLPWPLLVYTVIQVTWRARINRIHYLFTIYKNKISFCYSVIVGKSPLKHWETLELK